MDQAKVREVWRGGNSQIDAVLGRGFEEYLHSRRRWKDALCLDDGNVRCIDGRTPGGIHLAGSGILLGLEGAEEFVRSAQKAMKKSYGVDVITWHPDCGAAAVWSKENGGDVSANAKGFSEELSGRLGLRSRRIENQGEDGFHHERAVYYDNTGLFDWSKADLPVGFVVSRRYLDFDPAYAMSELGMAIGIALGNHGFGELFDEQRPFLVVSVAFKQDEQKRGALAKRECEKVVASLESKDQNRVKVVEALI